MTAKIAITGTITGRGVSCRVGEVMFVSTVLATCEGVSWIVIGGDVATPLTVIMPGSGVVLLPAALVAVSVTV